MHSISTTTRKVALLLLVTLWFVPAVQAVQRPGERAAGEQSAARASSPRGWASAAWSLLTLLTGGGAVSGLPRKANTCVDPNGAPQAAGTLEEASAAVGDVLADGGR